MSSLYGVAIGYSIDVCIARVNVGMDTYEIVTPTDTY